MIQHHFNSKLFELSSSVEKRGRSLLIVTRSVSDQEKKIFPTTLFPHIHFHSTKVQEQHSITTRPTVTLRGFNAATSGAPAMQLEDDFLRLVQLLTIKPEAKHLMLEITMHASRDDTDSQGFEQEK